MTTLSTVIAAAGGDARSPLILLIAVLVLAAFVGFEVISKVPNTLHTPLMSGTNAIHGIVLLGGVLVIGVSSGALNKVILVIAIVFGTINVVGGFLVTDRMLEMFKPKRKPPEVEAAAPTEQLEAAPESAGGTGAGAGAAGAPARPSEAGA